VKKEEKKKKKRKKGRQGANEKGKGLKIFQEHNSTYQLFNNVLPIFIKQEKKKREKEKKKRRKGERKGEKKEVVESR